MDQRNFTDVKQKLDKIVLEFQLGDIEKALQKATANFLAAKGIVQSTEFIGGVDNGLLGLEPVHAPKHYRRGVARLRFEKGIQRLGGRYSRFGYGRCWRLRNGLVHSYLPSVVSGVPTMIYNDPSSLLGLGFHWDPKLQQRVVAVNPARWAIDLRRAYQQLLADIQRRPGKLRLAVAALNRIPPLS